MFVTTVRSRSIAPACCAAASSCGVASNGFSLPSPAQNALPPICGATPGSKRRVSSAHKISVLTPKRSSTAAFCRRNSRSASLSASIRPPEIFSSKSASSCSSSSCQRRMPRFCSGSVAAAGEWVSFARKSNGSNCKCRLPALPPEASPLAVPASSSCTFTRLQ
jgi:hypothetical protein